MREERYFYPITKIENSTSRKKAILVEPKEVIRVASLLPSSISMRFLIGSAQHETNFALNEVDTEETGFQTFGLFQLSKDEAKEMGNPNADLLDLYTSVRIFCRLMEKRLESIIKAANLIAPYPNDIWAYLALCHNQGKAACLKTIKNYGLNWEAYKNRNPKLRIVSSRYGDDCITGGKYFLMLSPNEPL